MKNKYFYRSLIATTTLAALLPVTGIQAAAEESTPSSAVTAPNTAGDSTSTSETAESDVDSTSDDSKESTAPDSSNDKEDTDKVTKPDAAPSPSSNNKPAATKAKESVAELAEGIVNTGSLTWGIRTSFNNYTGGPTSVFDGAKENDSKNEFTFELEKTSYDPKTERFEAQFKGGIHYKKYCNGTDTCDLDLKLENPRIVIAKEGSFVYGNVSSKQYKKSETYTNNGDVPIAELYTAGADFNHTDTTVSWKNIPSTLTQAGNKMFSEFYSVGSGLAPVSFTFDTSKHPDIKRPTFDNAKFRVASATFNNKAPYELHRNMFSFNGEILLATSGYRFTQHQGSGLALLDRDLNQKHFTDIKINEYGAVTFDPEKGDFYYVSKKEESTRTKKIYTDDKTTLFKVHVDSEKGFGTPEKVHTFEQGITALGYHPETKNRCNSNPTQLGIVKQGAFTTQPLPSSADLLKQEGFEEYSSSHVYGSPSNINDPFELLPMDDGTFVLNANGEGKKDGQKLYGLMVSIDPDKTHGEFAKLLANSGTSVVNLASSAAHSNGSTIVRVNKNSYSTLSYAQSFTYSNGNLSSAHEPVQTTDVAGWGNLFINKEGQVITLNGGTGKLEWRDSQTFKPLDDIDAVAIPNGDKTYEHIHGPILQLDEGTFYVPSYDASEGEGNETYSLRKVYDPKFVPSVKDTNKQEDLLKEDLEDSKPSTPIWQIVLSVLGGLGLVGALVGFLFQTFIAR
ncbi:HtaA domain-containing protein [Corynebacterium ulcerans]|uniref:HtaA domain-containing protein n=1 Tax=Corynebacterium ulcerans TaxID=65058 RepID=UPI0005FEA803|nr:HtaA domain-containing protein [Corynebacterium ulcerans]AKA97663.1 Cell-surface hemin receptor [Corynebacterium ulcerans]